MILESKAPAKINLGLYVLRKRKDGYHDIETVFVRIGLHDTLQIAPAASFSFTCSDPSLPVNSNNLCVRAAYVMAHHFNIDPKIALHLEKRIPYGAGLGGGSSDAAHTLRLMNDFFGLGASRELLHSFAAKLGSDVPFFLGETAALGTGRGELLTPLRTAGGKPYNLPGHLLLAIPSVHVSTKEAYQYVTPNETGRLDLGNLVLTNDLGRWRKDLVNDFEASVFKSYPVIEDVKHQLYQLGASYASMSGSGSSVFGLFPNPELCQNAAIKLQEKGISVWVENRNN